MNHLVDGAEWQSWLGNVTQVYRVSESLSLNEKCGWTLCHADGFPLRSRWWRDTGVTRCKGGGGDGPSWRLSERERVADSTTILYYIINTCMQSPFWSWEERWGEEGVPTQKKNEWKMKCFFFIFLNVIFFSFLVRKCFIYTHRERERERRPSHLLCTQQSWELVHAGWGGMVD